MLVAGGAPPDEVFAGAVGEVGRLLPVDFADMGRYGPGGTITFVAAWGAGDHSPVARHWMLEGRNLGTMVFETARPARIDDYGDASGPLGVAACERGFRSAVATPIVVAGSLWGVVIAGSRFNQPMPAGTEARLADFTELLAAAIANAESRTALAASRARIVAAADDTRRRIERDLHDRAQQRIVSLVLQLRAAEAGQAPEARQLNAQIKRGLAEVLDELREISRGIHPAVLSRGGLEPALTVLARRSALPVELNVRAKCRLPEPIEVAAYYVVSEALTNAAKHAQASVVRVELEARDAIVQLAISDDGIGGADPADGTGLVGLRDRVEVLGGTIEVTSPAGRGTTLLIEIPLEGERSAGSPGP
jgi:signal transduction histidine kinase